MPATPNAARGTPGVDTSRIEQILADLELAGMGPPGADTYEPQQFQATGFQRFLEGLSPLASQQMGPPQGFGGGLIQGLSRGLGNAGARIGDEREKFEEAEAKRRASNDALRLEATREHRKTVFGELRAGREKDDTAAREEKRFAREHDPKQIAAESAARARGTAAGTPDKPGEDAAVQLSPAGLDAAAMMYARTGTLPPMGIGKATAGVRTKIINRAAEINPDLNIAANKAGFESTRAALTNIRKIHTASKAFEQTALKNATVLEGTLTKLANTGSPWLNRPMRMLQSQGAGDPNVAAFNTAIRTVTPEFARLLSSPTASGQLSDAARKEIESILSPNATPAQIMASLNVLRQDAHNRTTSYEEQIRSLEDELAHPGKTGTQENPASTPGTAQSRTRRPLADIFGGP